MLYILRGLPASGKSTWRKNQSIPYVNADELRLDHPTLSEKEIQEIMRERVKGWLSIKQDCIVDNTNINPKVVQMWQSIASNYGHLSEVVEFNTPWQECIARDSVREQSVGRSVIIKMAIDLGVFHQEVTDCYIFDIDGTLADIEHRRKYVQVKPKDWNSFYAGVKDDHVNFPVATTMRLLSYSVPIILVSGRRSETRKDTETWLFENRLDDYFALFMRGFNDFRDDTIVKQEIYEKYIKPYWNVLAVFDDRSSVVKMWRDNGLACFQVAEGDF
jgi:predicted kinase